MRLDSPAARLAEDWAPDAGRDGMKQPLQETT
jgi:hypothetical protein